MRVTLIFQVPDIFLNNIRPSSSHRYCAQAQDIEFLSARDFNNLRRIYLNSFMNCAPRLPLNIPYISLAPLRHSGYKALLLVTQDITQLSSHADIEPKMGFSVNI